MSVETWVFLIFIGFVALATAFWTAWRLDRQQARASNILSHSKEQLRTADGLNRTADGLQRAADQLQRREAELLSRWEAVVARLEVMAARWEASQDAEPGAAPDRRGV